MQVTLGTIHGRRRLPKVQERPVPGQPRPAERICSRSALRIEFAMHNATLHLKVSHDKISGLLIVIIRQAFNA